MLVPMVFYCYFKTILKKGKIARLEEFKTGALVIHHHPNRLILWVRNQNLDEDHTDTLHLRVSLDLSKRGHPFYLYTSSPLYDQVY